MPVTGRSDEIFSQTKRRFKMRLIGPVGTSHFVIHTKCQEDLPRGSSEISQPHLLGSRLVVANSMLAELGNSRLTVRRDSFVSTLHTHTYREPQPSFYSSGFVSCIFLFSNDDDDGLQRHIYSSIYEFHHHSSSSVSAHTSISSFSPL